MKGDVARDVVCPVELACPSCDATVRTFAEAEAHARTNPGHAVGPCGAVLRPRRLTIRADNGGTWGTKYAATPETVAKRAVRQHIHQRHPGYGPREVSLMLDAAVSAGETGAGPVAARGHAVALPDPSDPVPARPDEPAHASGRADSPSGARKHKPFGPYVAVATK